MTFWAREAVGDFVGKVVGEAVGDLVGASGGGGLPSSSVAVPPTGKLTVVGSTPALCKSTGGKVISSMSVTVSPTGPS